MLEKFSCDQDPILQKLLRVKSRWILLLQNFWLEISLKIWPNKIQRDFTSTLFVVSGLGLFSFGLFSFGLSQTRHQNKTESVAEKKIFWSKKCQNVGHAANNWVIWEAEKIFGNKMFVFCWVCFEKSLKCCWSRAKEMRGILFRRLQWPHALN